MASVPFSTFFTAVDANIERIRRENRVQNIYMCKKNEYFEFPEMILAK